MFCCFVAVAYSSSSLNNSIKSRVLSTNTQQSWIWYDFGSQNNKLSKQKANEHPTRATWSPCAESCHTSRLPARLSLSLLMFKGKTQRLSSSVGVCTFNEAWDRKFWLPHHATHGNLRQSSSIIIFFHLSLRCCAKQHIPSLSPLYTSNMIVVLDCGILPLSSQRGITMTKKIAYNGTNDDDDVFFLRDDI